MVRELRVMRVRLGITQYALSAKTGIPEKRISLYENGYKALRSQDKEKIAGALGIAMSDIFREEEGG